MENTNAFRIIGVEGSFNLSSRLETEKEIRIQFPKLIHLILTDENKLKSCETSIEKCEELIDELNRTAHFLNEKIYFVRQLTCKKFIDLKGTTLTVKGTMTVEKVDLISELHSIRNHFKEILIDFNKFGIQLIGNMSIFHYIGDDKNDKIVFDRLSYDENGKSLYSMLEMRFNNSNSTITLGND